MNKLFSRKVLPYTLMAAMIFSGCGKKSECEIPSRHVHKYTKEITDDITIERYIDDERLNVNGYQWNEEYIEITKEDEDLYKIFKSKNLFEGRNNWDYLYNEMATHHDYLKFYYEYTTIETYTTTDSKGNIETHTRTVHHDGWHTNPYDSDNTGKTRLYHHRYYGYRIVYEDGKFKVEQSPAVDDIREIIDEYPYFSENCVTTVYEQFRFRKSELRYLSPEDFDVFTGPDLEKRELETVKTKIKK